VAIGPCRPKIRRGDWSADEEERPVCDEIAAEHLPLIDQEPQELIAKILFS